MQLTRNLFFTLMGAVAFIASSMLFISLKHGIGVSPDSVAYIRAAAEFREEGNFHSFPSHWPPLYPLLLSFVGSFSANTLLAIKLFHSIMFGLNVVVISIICIPEGTHRNLSCVLFSVFLFLSPQFFSIHQMAWSEVPFITLLFAGLVLPYKNQSKKIILLSAVLIGLATLTRYAGIYFIAIGALSTLILSKGTLLKKSIFSLVYFLIALLPLLTYSIYNLATRGSSTNRELAIHLASIEHVKALANMLATWFLPNNPTSLSSVLIGLLCLLVLVSLTYSVLKSDLKLTKNWTFFLFSIGLGYVAFIFISISFFDAYTPIDVRIFLPLYISLWGTIFALLSTRLKDSPRFIAIIPFTLIVVVTYTNSQKTKDALSQSIHNGVGFLSKDAAKLPILNAAAKLSKHKSIYTNALDFLYIHRGIDAKSIPKKYSPVSLKPTPDYQANIGEVISEISDGNAVMIYLSGFYWRQYIPTPLEVAATDELDIIYSGKDGVIFSKKLPSNTAK